MREIKQLIIHCADTYPDMDIRVEDIRKWHVDGNGWDDIGYHYVITRAGLVGKGRPDAVVGAHARGMNSNSLGICMVGGKSRDNQSTSNFTAEQWNALTSLCTNLLDQYPEAEVMGHCDVPDSGKTCPNFNVKAWWSNNV